MRAKKLLKISSLRWASARLSPSMYVMGFCQGFIANISRSTRASVRSSAFLHMPNACVSDESPLNQGMHRCPTSPLLLLAY